MIKVIDTGNGIDPNFIAFNQIFGFGMYLFKSVFTLLTFILARFCGAEKLKAFPPRLCIVRLCVVCLCIFPNSRPVCTRQSAAPKPRACAWHSLYFLQAGQAQTQPVWCVVDVLCNNIVLYNVAVPLQPRALQPRALQRHALHNPAAKNFT